MTLKGSKLLQNSCSEFRWRRLKEKCRKTELPFRIGSLSCLLNTSTLTACDKPLLDYETSINKWAGLHVVCQIFCP